MRVGRKQTPKHPVRRQTLFRLSRAMAASSALVLFITGGSTHLSDGQEVGLVRLELADLIRRRKWSQVV